MDAWNYKCRIDLQEIILKQAEKKILSQYSENQKPNESCAILFGKNNQVLDVFLTKNIDESPVNFTISNNLFYDQHPLFLGEYNQAFKNSNFLTDFGFTEGYKTTSASKKAGDKSHFFTKFSKNFKIFNYFLINF